MMTRETAFEMDDFLTGLEAGVSTLLTIHDHFCIGEAISQGVAKELDYALFTINNYLFALVKGKRKQVDEAFEQIQAEQEANKKANRAVKEEKKS